MNILTPDAQILALIISCFTPGWAIGMTILYFDLKKRTKYRGWHQP
jgi:hypothetical protein